MTSNLLYSFGCYMPTNYDIIREIYQLLKRKQTIKFLLQKYENLRLIASLVYRQANAPLLKRYEDDGIVDPYTFYNNYPYGRVDDLRQQFQDYGRDYVGKDFLIAYVETFDHFAKTLKESNEFAEKIKELAQKMAEEVQNLEAKNSEEPESLNCEKQEENLMKIKQKIMEMGKGAMENIFDEIGKKEGDENQQEETILGEIFHAFLFLAPFESFLEKFDEQYKMTEHLIIQNSGVPKQQAKYFAMVELNLMMLGQLRTIAEKITKKERIILELEDIIKALNEWKEEMAEMLKIGSEKLELISNLAKNSANSQNLLEEIVAGIEGLKGENESEQTLFIEKFKDYLCFGAYAYIVSKVIGQMGEIIDKIQAEHGMVKGAENIRNSFAVLKEMQNNMED